MKKIITLAALLFVSTGAFAQLSYGVKAGMNLANISNAGGSIKPGLFVGAVGEYSFNDFVGLQAELVYSRQGYYDKSDIEGLGNMKVWARYNYINIPVLAKLYLIDRSFSLELGPQFGFIAGAKNKVTVAGSTDKTDISKDSYNNFDFSFGLGVSYMFAFGPEISLRYNIGITDIAKNNTGDTKFKNNVIQIGVGYRF